MKKKIIISLLIIVIIIGLTGLAGIYIKSSYNKKTNQNKLWEDYNSGKISIDEFVKGTLDNPSEFVDIDMFVYNNSNKLNKSTIYYYLEKINLKDVTFELDKENNENSISYLDLFIEPVYAKEKIKNLNKVVLSKNNNFLIWYTTTGKSAITKEQAEKMADGLEDSIESYRKIIGQKYNFESINLSKGKRYEDKQKILEKNNIDKGYLDSAMQVYLLEYDDDALAKYVSRKTASKLSSEFHEIFGNDINGAIEQPYILIKPSSITDYERLEQLYNHELFHHYQFEILCGYFDCELIKDKYISEASANWASSLITSKQSREGFLNDWAGTSRKYSDSLLSDEMIKKNGENNLSYALFVYLNYYSSYVNNGTNKIIDSIYKEDALKYLYDNATLDELATVQENVALNYIYLDSYNKNLIAAPSYNSFIPFKANIKKELATYPYSFDNELPPLAMQFYQIINANLKVEIEKNNDIAVYLIKINNNKNDVTERLPLNSNEYTIDLYEDEITYIVVANLSLISKNDYKIVFKRGENRPIEEEKKKELNFMSFDNCEANIDEELLKEINTYYYDENNKVYKLRITLFLSEEADMDFWFENVSTSNHTNIKKKGNIIQYDYTDETFNKRYGGRTIDSIKDYYRPACYDPVSGNVDAAIIKFNPDEI